MLETNRQNLRTMLKNLFAGALFIAGFVFLDRDVVIKLVHDWATDDNYSHGFLIVPIALYLV